MFWTWSLPDAESSRSSRTCSPYFFVELLWSLVPSLEKSYFWPKTSKLEFILFSLLSTSMTFPVQMMITWSLIIVETISKFKPRSNWGHLGSFKNILTLNKTASEINPLIHPCFHHLKWNWCQVTWQSVDPRWPQISNQSDITFESSEKLLKVWWPT